MPSTLPDRPDMVWDPQLQPYPEDEALWSSDPFGEFFALKLKTTQTRSSSNQNWDLLQAELDTEEWNNFAYDYLDYCLGGGFIATDYETGLKLTWTVVFDVLFLRYCHQDQGEQEGEDLALRRLLEAQRHPMFSVLDEPPADFCWLDDLEKRDTYATDPDAGDRESDWEDIDSQSDEVDDPMEGLDTEYVPDFIQFPSKPCPAVIPATFPSALPEACGSLPYKWYMNIQAFFYPVGNPEKRRSKKEVVDNLKEMRDLGERDYNSAAFQDALEDSGLLKCLHEICDLGNLLETSHRKVEKSFRFHNWKISYADMICRWTRPSITKEEYERNRPQVDPHYKFEDKDAMELLIFMSSHRRMHPWAHNPMAAFMFISLNCFKFHSETWFVPCLRTLGYPRTDGWDAKKVHRTLLRLPVFVDSKSKESKLFLKGLKDRKLVTVIRETCAYRRIMKRVKKHAWRPNFGATSDSSPPDTHTSSPAPSTSKAPSAGTRRNVKKRVRAKQEGRRSREELEKLAEKGTALEHRDLLELQHCPICEDLDGSEQCIRTILVTERPDVENLIGTALTSAPVGDRLEPVPVKRKKKTAAPGKKPPPLQYLDPEQDLGLTWVRPRDQVQKRCGRDINRFVCDPDTQGEEAILVGGVRYNAFEPTILQRLINNHRRVKVRGVRRRGILQRWNHGTMTPSGHRQPRGGIRGDGYGPYSAHRGDTIDDIKALFCHAVDADILIEVGSTIAPKMRSRINALSAATEGGRMGRFSVEVFYCTNYISALHPDFDANSDRTNPDIGDIYPCAQYTQTGTDKNRHEWDFAMPTWGVAIETRGNTVW
ncbi:hypothetical protein B0H11DRAFT_2231005 [Mycena galericulata]|nr:hypothetical protein B0H11DRAFT_2231005 [Mycena galericulata]